MSIYVFAIYGCVNECNKILPILGLVHFCVKANKSSRLDVERIHTAIAHVY